MVLQREASSPDQLRWVRGLLDQHEGPLLRYARRITLDEGLARDVVQDTFCRLLAQPRERVDGREAEWLFTVCRNRALDVRRKEGRMTRSEGALADRTSREPQPGKVLEGKEQSQRLLQLVETLPEKQRDVVLLKFQNGLSYKEISHITSHSVSNVGYLLHTAIKTLRNKLQAQPGLAV